MYAVGNFVSGGSPRRLLMLLGFGKGPSTKVALGRSIPPVRDDQRRYVVPLDRRYSESVLLCTIVGIESIPGPGVGYSRVKEHGGLTQLGFSVQATVQYH